MKINYGLAVEFVYKTIVILLLGLIATILWTIEWNDTNNTMAVKNMYDGLVEEINSIEIEIEYIETN